MLFAIWHTGPMIAGGRIDECCQGIQQLQDAV
jgi:hypothetical protein